MVKKGPTLGPPKTGGPKVWILSSYVGWRLSVSKFFRSEKRLKVIRKYLIQLQRKNRLEKHFQNLQNLSVDFELFHIHCFILYEIHFTLYFALSIKVTGLLRTSCRSESLAGLTRHNWRDKSENLLFYDPVCVVTWHEGIWCLFVFVYFINYRLFNYSQFWGSFLVFFIDSLAFIEKNEIEFLRELQKLMEK